MKIWGWGGLKTKHKPRNSQDYKAKIVSEHYQFLYYKDEFQIGTRSSTK